jgi:predicted enzyme related to lactoylglutathione lyase
MSSRRQVLKGIGVVAALASTVSSRSLRASSAQTPSPFNMKVGRVGACVANLELAIKFYSALGYDRGDHVKDENLSDLLEMENVTASISHRPFDETELELVQIGEARDPGIPARRPMNQQGISHMVLRVTDVDRIAGVISANGGQVIKKTRSISLGPDAIFCTDPDGARILLIGPGELANGPPVRQLDMRPCVFSHYGICVADLELSGKFYKAFGFEVAPIKTVGGKMSALAELGNIPLSTRLIKKGPYAFELMQWGPARPPGVPARRSLGQQGFTHIGTSGDDVEEQIAHFKSIGGTVVESAVYRPKGSNIKVIFCTDPDGVRIELVGPVST